MKVLILGGEGMLGHKVYQVLSRRFDAYATFREAQGLWRRYPVYEHTPPGHCFGGVDVISLDSVIKVVGELKPEVVINCIGIVKQLEEARDPILSLQLNSLFPHRLAGLCAAAGARLFHVSTDCVFSGRKGLYTEEDVPDAEDLYGRTKLLGEVNRPGCLTIRTSIFGRDFLKQSALLEWFLSRRGGRANGYRHAIYSGFPTQVLARIMGDLMADHPGLSGLYQIASRPLSKYELLLKIREAMKLDIEVVPYDDPPCDRSLSASRFLAATGYRIPDWDEMMAELAADVTPYDAWRKQYGTA